jgi:hypothetical protein
MTDQQLQSIKEANPLFDVVADVVQLKKNGFAFVGLCPFHDERTPSFNVSPQKNLFKCHGCEKGGDVVTFVQLNAGLDFREAVEWLARRAGLPMPSTDAKNARHGHERKRAAHRPSFLEKMQLRPKQALPTGPLTFYDVAERDASAANFAESDFFRFLASTIAGHERAATVAGFYFLGTTSGRRVVFWNCDAVGNVHSAKAVPYNVATGKRTKGGPFKDAEYLRPGNGGAACFFGEHLLPVFPDLPVHVHESEKTAVIATLHDMITAGGVRRVHVATGGKERLAVATGPDGLATVATIARWRPFAGRKIVLWPDASKDGKALNEWTAHAATLRRAGFDCRADGRNQTGATDEQRAAGWDRADAILSEWSNERDERERVARLCERLQSHDLTTVHGTNGNGRPVCLSIGAHDLEKICLIAAGRWALATEQKKALARAGLAELNAAIFGGANT